MSNERKVEYRGQLLTIPKEYPGYNWIATNGDGSVRLFYLKPSPMQDFPWWKDNNDRFGMVLRQRQTSSVSDVGVRNWRDTLEYIGEVAEATATFANMLPRDYFTNMSLRDYFAAKAMYSLLTTMTEFPDEHWQTGLAMAAYRMADAMLAERDRLTAAEIGKAKP